MDVEDIVASPDLFQEAKARISELKAMAAPGGVEAVRFALQPLVLAFGMGDAARAAAFWGPYVTTLATLPARALKAAADEYVALPTSEFFPKPGPFKSIAEKHAEPLRKAAWRAEQAIRRKSALKPPMPTQAEREAAVAASRAFAAQVASKPANSWRQARAVREPARPSALYVQEMARGIEGSASTVHLLPAVILAAQMDERAQGRLEPGLHITGRLADLQTSRGWEITVAPEAPLQLVAPVEDDEPGYGG